MESFVSFPWDWCKTIANFLSKESKQRSDGEYSGGVEGLRRWPVEDETWSGNVNIRLFEKESILTSVENPCRAFKEHFQVIDDLERKAGERELWATKDYEIDIWSIE